MRHALGLDVGHSPELILWGFTPFQRWPASGLNEAEARQRYGGVLVGRARFDELGVARSPDYGRSPQAGSLMHRASACLAYRSSGEGATELIHVGQMGLLAYCDVDTFCRAYL